MGINLVVAITDGDWYDFLRNRPDLTEVNFWAPGGQTNFRALRDGELLLFKLHSPRNFIVGFGVFRYATLLPCSYAWEAFGDQNGAEFLAVMRRRIARYRHVSEGNRENFQIGCRILSEPVFFPQSAWIPVPDSWARATQRYKAYDTASADGLDLWDAVHLAAEGLSRPPGLDEGRARYGEPSLVAPRLGQGAFRIIVADNYNRKCAVTGERTLPALDAAHIRPYGDGGDHSPRNGLLLRKDIHSLFNAGYVTITPASRFEVSRKIKEEFENGRDYYALHGRPVTPPRAPDARPDTSLLTWHNEHIYRG